MVGEAAQKKLYDAAREGDLATFKEMLQEDPFLLDVVSFACSRNLLHIAITHGHVSIVKEVLRINVQLARDLDSKSSSSLHIAVAQKKPKTEIVEELLEVAPEMCWWRDSHDMNPIHIAAMNGHVVILEKLLQKNRSPTALERVHRGQTVLHLCVKHDQIKALELLVDKLGDLVHAKDDDGETIMHLAVRCNQDKMIEFLVEKSNKIETLTPNSIGKTALAVLHENRDLTKYSEMRDKLVCLSDQSFLQSLHKMTDMTLVVVVLIATMAFQAAVSPPGGVWQDTTFGHRAGKAVMASIKPTMYKHFVCANTTAFISSLITIFIITTDGPSRHFFFLTTATYGMWVSVASIALAYGVSMIMTNPLESESFDHIVVEVVFVFLGIFALMFGYLAILALYSSWTRKNPQHIRVRNMRDLHQIFQLFNSAPEDTFLRVRVLFRGLFRVLTLCRDRAKVQVVDEEGIGEKMGTLC